MAEHESLCEFRPGGALVRADEAVALLRGGRIVAAEAHWEPDDKYHAETSLDCVAVEVSHPDEGRSYILVFDAHGMHTEGWVRVRAYNASACHDDSLGSGATDAQSAAGRKPLDHGPAEWSDAPHDSTSVSALGRAEPGGARSIPASNRNEAPAVTGGGEPACAAPTHASSNDESEIVRNLVHSVPEAWRDL